MPGDGQLVTVHTCAHIYMADATTYLTDAHRHRLRILWSHACTRFGGELTRGQMSQPPPRLKRVHCWLLVSLTPSSV